MAKKKDDWLMAPFSGNGGMLGELRRGVDDVFGNLFTLSPRMAEFMEPSDFLSPRVDVSESDKEIKVCAELPGVKEKDVKVSYENNLLTIRANKDVKRETKKENYHKVERSSGEYMRTFRIPYEIEPNKIDAIFEDGVLTVTAPKPKGAKKALPASTIKVKKGKASKG